MLLEEKIFLGIVGAFSGLLMALFVPLYIITAICVLIITAAFALWLFFFLFDRDWGEFTTILFVFLIVLFGSVLMVFIIINGAA